MEELGGINRKDVGELFEHIDCCCVFRTFEHADVVAIDTSTVSKLLLRKPLGVAQPTQIPRYHLPQTHRERRPRYLIYCHPIYWGINRPSPFSRANAPLRVERGATERVSCRRDGAKASRAVSSQPSAGQVEGRLARVGQSRPFADDT